MHGFLLSSLLLLQGIPIQRQQGGTVTGILRDGAGTPVSGVRVAAVAVPESPAELQSSTAMGAIAETDANGQYRLENVPPGRYYIAAGRLDLPTYYPGTLDMSKGTIVGVTAGSISTQTNFTMHTESAGRSMSGFGGMIAALTAPVPTLLLPIEIRVENSGKIPVFGPSGFIRLVFDRLNGAPKTTLSADVQQVRIPGPGPLDYRVTFENMPLGYTLKSMTYDGAPLRTGALHLPAANFTVTTSATIFAPAGAPVTLPFVIASGSVNPVSAPLPAGPPIVINLGRSENASTGAHVRGVIPGPLTRSIHLSGKPGFVFADGTFEFHDVPPGQHSIFTLDGSPLVASVVVGRSDVDGVRLQSSPVLPVGILEPATPAPADTNASGVLPLGSLRVTARNQETQDPLVTGMAFLTGGAFGASRPLSEDGTFEFSPLLPGKYRVEIQSYGFETMRREVVIGGASVDLKIDAIPASR